MIFILLLCLAFQPLPESNMEHAIYLSVMEIEIGEDETTVVVKVFADDLRDALHGYDKKYKSTMTAFIDAELQTYFNSYIHIVQGDELMHLSQVDHNLEGESVFIEFVADMPLSQSEIEIKASYFFELFPSQSNVLKLKNASQQEFRIFKNKEQREVIQLTH